MNVIRPRPLWVVIAAACLITGLAMSLRQVMGLYMRPVTMDLGIGREPFSNAMAVSNLVAGFGGILFGAWTDRWGAGRSVATGIVCMFGGFLMTAIATSSAELMAAGVLMGLGSSGAGITALAGPVGRAAPADKRTAALASMGMAMGIAGFLAFPYTHVLIEYFGWRGSLFAIAGTVAVTLPLTIAIAGKAPSVATFVRQQTLTQAFSEAFATRGYWLLTAGFFVCGFHVAFYSVHLPAFVQDKGLGAWVGVWALMALGIANIAGTWLAGRSGAFFQKRTVLSGIYFARAVLFVAMLWLPTTPVTVIAITAAIGLFWLATVPLTSSLVATFFGTTWMSMLFGFVFLSHQLGAFLGLYLAGVLFDATHSYDTMWVISAGIAVVAGLLHMPIQERPVARLRAAPAV